MSKSVICVVGATGTQGASVVDSFISDPRWQVRAVTRNPESSAARALAERGCEVVKADLGDFTSLKAAFHGVSAIFAVTNYWEPFFDSDIGHRLKPGQNIPEYCYEEEVRLGINLAEAAATSLETLTHYIWSTLSSPAKWSKGKYTKILHFEAKAKITEHIHEKLPRLAAKMSAVQIAFYATNLYNYELMRPQKQVDGTFRLDRLIPPKSKLPFIDTRKDTGPFVKALIERDPGNTLLAYTAMTSFHELTEMLNRVTGKKVSYYQCSLEEIRIRFPNEGEEGSMSDVYALNYGFHGGDPTCLMPKDLGFEEHPDAIENCLAQLDWASILI